MHYGAIKKYDIADGLGVRVSLFVSGCTNGCPGCFQKQTWDFEYGEEYTDQTEKEVLDALAEEFIQGLTILGGEPFEIANQRVLVQLLKKARRLCPHKDIWCYSGFVYERDLVAGGRRHCEVTDEMLGYIDVLVDGPFIEEQRNIMLKFRGSKNQRVIDMKKTLAQGHVVLYLD